MCRGWSCVLALVFAAVVVSSGPGPGEAGVTRWSFDGDRADSLPRGFTADKGTWLVAPLRRGGNALAQMASNPDEVFNVILADAPTARDLTLSVRLRAMAGDNDQGGGVVWRARDAKNYYIARFNPLEDNFRVYTVVDGKRTQLGSADVKASAGWHTLQVAMTGDHITCALDGKALLDVHDRTFPDAGKVGLWSKSDARTEFDDLALAVR